jgi:restriction endonuclease S subunit
MILRPKPRSGLDSVVLYEFLSNDTVQEFISTMAGGSVIKNLGMKDLKVFPVPVPTTAQVSDLHEKFSERQEIFDLIENLEGTIVQKRAEQWPHADLDS